MEAADALTRELKDYLAVIDRELDRERELTWKWINLGSDYKQEWRDFEERTYVLRRQRDNIIAQLVANLPPPPIIVESPR